MTTEGMVNRGGYFILGAAVLQATAGIYLHDAGYAKELRNEQRDYESRSKLGSHAVKARALCLKLLRARAPRNVGGRTTFFSHTKKRKCEMAPHPHPPPPPPPTTSTLQFSVKNGRRSVVVSALARDVLEAEEATPGSSRGFVEYLCSGAKLPSDCLFFSLSHFHSSETLACQTHCPFSSQLWWGGGRGAIRPGPIYIETPPSPPPSFPLF